jgi:cell division protease FtsH
VLSAKYRRKRFYIPAALLVVALVGAGIYATRRHAIPPELAFSEFLQRVDHGQVSQVRFADGTLTFALTDGTVAMTVPPPSFLAADSTFITSLARHGVRIEIQQIPEPGALTPGAIAIAGFFLALLGFTVYRTTTGRIHTPGKAKVAERDGVVVTFRDVAGVDEAKDEVREIVEFLRQPGRFSSLGGRIPKGVLLVGPPGTGKTLLARSIAGEAGVPFIFASGSDFVEMYAGVGAARVRRLFKDARKHKSCIIFIDELDAVGRSRGGNSLSHEEREQTLNQLLVEMDGFSRADSIVVVAATNRADILDSALLRPGRFYRQVMVGNPDLNGREQILRVHTRKVELEPDVDLRSIARGTPGFSGADLANLVNEGALIAARLGRHTVSNADMQAARDKVLMGAERRSLIMSEHERNTCAYHEAGHAIVAALLPEADPLHKVTIIPRGRALGVTMQLPVADRHAHSKSFLETQIAILMAGRVAEELCLRQMTSGASNDIERATELARKMVCELGMSTLGPVHFRRPSGAWDADSRAAGFSEDAARRVDDEISALIMHGYETARQIIERERPAVRALALELLEVESVDGERLKQLIAQNTAGDSVSAGA